MVHFEGGVFRPAHVQHNWLIQTCLDLPHKGLIAMILLTRNEVELRQNLNKKEENVEAKREQQ